MLKVFLSAISLAFESIITVVLSGMIFVLSFFVMSQGLIFSLEKAVSQYAVLDYRYWLIGLSLVLISYLFGNVATRKTAT